MVKNRALSLGFILIVNLWTPVFAQSAFSNLFSDPNNGFTLSGYLLARALEVDYDNPDVNVSAHGYGGELAGGYELRFAEQFGLDVELFGNGSSGQTGKKSSEFGQATMTWTAGVRAMPGVYFTNNNQLFIDLGATSGRLLLKGDDISGTFSEYLWGFRAGLGFRTELTDRLSLMFRYAETYYQQSEKVHLKSGGDMHLQPETNQFSLGVNYRLDDFI